jgi:hypothetical protein
MNARLALPLLAGLAVTALMLALAMPVAGQSGGIQVNNADAMRTTSMSQSSGLNSLLSGVSLRIVTQYANALRYIGLSAPSSSFQSLLNQTAQRIVLLAANAARQMGMVYPRELVNDGAAPVISGATAAPAAGGIRITWTTDEFADSTVIFGTQPGGYPQSRSDPLYVKSHAILLTGLAPGTYYYRVQSRDLSGNLAQSAEGSFTAGAGSTQQVYLPMLVR